MGIAEIRTPSGIGVGMSVSLAIPAAPAIPEIPHVPPAPAEESYDNPVSTNSPEDVVWAYNATSGKWDMLYLYFPGSFYWTAIAIDQDTGTVYKWEESVAHGNSYRLNFHLPAYVDHTDDTTHFSEVGILSHTSDIVYDAANKTWMGVAEGVAWPVPVTISDYLVGEMHQVEIGTDGLLYFGGGWRDVTGTANNYRVCVVRRNADGTYQTFGPIGRKQGTQELQGFAYCDGWIYAANARAPYTLVAFDVSRQSEPDYYGTELFVCTTGGFAGATQLRYGAECAISIAGETRVGYWLYNGASVAKTGAYATVPPWPGGSTAAASTWTPAPTKPTLDETQIVPQPPNPTGDCQLTYTDTGGPHVAQWTVTLYPTAIGRVFPLSNGKLLVFAGAYTGAYLFDPATETSDWQGTTAALSAYSAASVGAHLYVGGYGNGRWYDYDEAQAWEGDTGDNPDYVANVKDDIELDVDALMCATACDGIVYFAGQDRRSNGDGALIAYKPATADMAGVGHGSILEWYATDYVAAVGTQYVVVSTHRITGSDGLKPDSGAIFVYDKSLAVDEFAAGAMETCLGDPVLVVEGVKGTGKVVAVSATQVVGWCAVPTYSAAAGWSDSTTQSHLYRMNVVTGVIQEIVTVNVRVPWNYAAQGELNDLSVGPDGNVYAFFNGMLMRIDPQNLASQTAIIAPVQGGGQCAWIGNDLYMAGKTSLRVIHDVVS